MTTIQNDKQALNHTRSVSYMLSISIPKTPLQIYTVHRTNTPPGAPPLSDHLQNAERVLTPRQPPNPRHY
jgi:hypothetical protein